MRSLDELIDVVGRERFDAACTWAWRTAKGTGGWDDDGEWPDDLAEVPHELDDFVYDAAPAGERMRLGIELYHAMPCYWNAVGMYHVHRELDGADRAWFWAEMRRLMDDPDDRLADPQGYTLWCDYFEDQSTVEEAWTELTGSQHPGGERRVRRAVELSGPVPWALKAPVLRRCLAHPELHVTLVRALAGAAFDVYGRIELDEARAIVEQLPVRSDLPELEAVRKRLRERRS